MFEEDEIDMSDIGASTLYAGIRELNREWQWEPLDDPDGSDWPEELGDSEC